MLSLGINVLTITMPMACVPRMQVNFPSGTCYTMIAGKAAELLQVCIAHCGDLSWPSRDKGCTHCTSLACSCLLGMVQPRHVAFAQVAGGTQSAHTRMR